MVSHALQTSLAQLLDASRARRSPAGGPPHESGCWSGRPVTGLGAAEHHSVGRSVIPGPRPCGRRRVKPPPEGSSATPSLASRITASGREYQFAAGDSGRSTAAPYGSPITEPERSSEEPIRARLLSARAAAQAPSQNGSTQSQADSAHGTRTFRRAIDPTTTAGPFKCPLELVLVCCRGTQQLSQPLERRRLFEAQAPSDVQNLVKMLVQASQAFAV